MSPGGGKGFEINFFKLLCSDKRSVIYYCYSNVVTDMSQLLHTDTKVQQ